MTPAERSKLGLARDVREDGGAKKKVAIVDKYNYPPGKFVERPGDNIGKARGRDVCGFCGRVCCSSMHYLICSLMDFGELEPNLWVCLVYLCEILNFVFRTIRRL